MPFLTGNDPAGDTVRYCIEVPDDFYFRQAVRGALWELSFASNWEAASFSELSPDEAAALAAVMFDTWQPDTGGSAGMERIQLLNIGGFANVTLTSIPAVYSAIKILYQARTARAANFDSAWLRLNGDTDANYDYFSHRRQQASAAIGTAEDQNEYLIEEFATGADTPAGHYAFGELWIDNANADVALPRGLTGRTFNHRTGSDASREQRYWSGRWNNTVDAITSIQIASNTSSVFDTGSFLDIYGVRA